MTITLDIVLRRPDKVYHKGENVVGTIVIYTQADFKHDGISLLMEGAVNLHVSSKNVGLMDAFYNAIKPIQLVNISCDVCAPGKLPAGRTEIPFDFPLEPKTNRTLFETYHGVFINISYDLRCDIKRSFLSKDIQKSQQFFVHYASQPMRSVHPVNFVLSPTSIKSKGVIIPDFLIEGKLDSTVCNILQPFTGHIILKHCQASVRSIELQLVRVETCGCAEGFAKEATEIQNIQIGEGDIAHNIPIPIYMIFPRLFTCPTLTTSSFKIEFEVNVVVIFENDHLITENFPISLNRNII